MRLRRDGNKLIFEDRPFVMPAVLGAATLLMAYRLWEWSGIEGWTRDNIGLAFGTLAMAVFTVLMAGGSRFTFNRTTGRVTWWRRIFLGTKKGGTTLANVKAIAIAVSVDSEGDKSWRGVMDLKDGSSLPLTVGYSGTEEQWQDIVSGISRYLGLADSEEETLTDKVTRMLRSGRKVEAIKLVRLETGMDLSAAKATVESIAH